MRRGPRLDVPGVLHYVMKCGIERRGKRILRRGKTSALVGARGAVCYLAVRELGFKSPEVGRALGLGQAGEEWAGPWAEASSL